MRKIAVLIFSILAISFFAPSAFAAKKFVPKVAVVSVSAVRIPTKNSVRAYFSNLRSVKTISYMLTYNSNGVGQGVSGSINPGKKLSVSRDLFLGTCSKNVCVRHNNPKNIKLQVTVTYVNNTSTSKTYNVK